MSTTATIAKLALPIVSKAFKDIYELGKEKYEEHLLVLKTKKAGEQLYKKIAAVEQVKTIWQVDKAVRLRSFYFPSRLLINGKPALVSSLEDVGRDHNYVLQGTIGQGKSTLLRYLCISELEKGDRFPLFVELRRMEKGQRLVNLLLSSLEVLGIENPTLKLFDFLAGTGKLLLLLDGFDEVSPDKVTEIISDIEKFVDKYSDMQIVVTSRPNSGIEQSPKLRVLQLAPLTPNDHNGFLSKIIPEKERRAELAKSIRECPSEIQALLTTPLMLTLLVLVYKSEQVIPRELSEFYESLFMTLLSRHDKTKPGYVRHRYTQLSDKSLQIFFETFCFISRNRSLGVFDEDALYATVVDACKYSGLPCGSDDFKQEMTKVACLMQEEAHKFYFVHKSVQEYYASMFIKRSPEAFAVRFYGTLLKEKKWFSWAQEIAFLSQTDQYRYKKYFDVPGIEQLFKECNLEDGPVPVEPNFEVSSKFLDTVLITFGKPEGKWIVTSLHMAQATSFHRSALVSRLVGVIFDAAEKVTPSFIDSIEGVDDDKTDTKTLPSVALLEDRNFLERISAEITRILNEFNESRLMSLISVKREEAKALELIPLSA
jgi:hypothetical protein